MGSRDSNTAFAFQSTNHLESYDWDAHGGVYYANRFRTQNHGISVSSLGVNMQSFRGEKSRIQLVFAISNREPVLIAPRPWNGDAGYLWASTGSLEVDALTTFYVGW